MAQSIRGSHTLATDIVGQRRTQTRRILWVITILSGLGALFSAIGAAVQVGDGKDLSHGGVQGCTAGALSAALVALSCGMIAHAMRPRPAPALNMESPSTRSETVSATPDVVVSQVSDLPVYGVPTRYLDLLRRLIEEHPDLQQYAGLALEDKYREVCQYVQWHRNDASADRIKRMLRDQVYWEKSRILRGNPRCRVNLDQPLRAQLVDAEAFVRDVPEQWLAGERLLALIRAEMGERHNGTPRAPPPSPNEPLPGLIVTIDQPETDL
jgi:hypothetical protein